METAFLHRADCPFTIYLRQRRPDFFYPRAERLPLQTTNQWRVKQMTAADDTGCGCGTSVSCATSFRTHATFAISCERVKRQNFPRVISRLRVFLSQARSRGARQHGGNPRANGQRNIRHDCDRECKDVSRVIWIIFLRVGRLTILQGGEWMDERVEEVRSVSAGSEHAERETVAPRRRRVAGCGTTESLQRRMQTRTRTCRVLVPFVRASRRSSSRISLGRPRGASPPPSCIFSLHHCRRSADMCRAFATCKMQRKLRTRLRKTSRARRARPRKINYEL